MEIIINGNAYDTDDMSDEARNIVSKLATLQILNETLSIAADVYQSQLASEIDIVQ